MGIKVLNGATRDYFDRQSNHARSTENRITALCDGQATKWSVNLANNEVWIDASAVYRPGAGQVGPTFQYQGAGSCLVYGTLGDRALARYIKDDPAYLPFVAATLPNWVQISSDPDTPGPLTAGKVAFPSGIVFDMFKLVFTGAGAVVILEI